MRELCERLAGRRHRAVSLQEHLDEREQGDCAAPCFGQRQADAAFALENRLEAAHLGFAQAGAKTPDQGRFRCVIEGDGIGHALSMAA